MKHINEDLNNTKLSNNLLFCVSEASSVPSASDDSGSTWTISAGVFLLLDINSEDVAAISMDKQRPKKIIFNSILRLILRMSTGVGLLHSVVFVHFFHIYTLLTEILFFCRLSKQDGSTIEVAAIPMDKQRTKKINILI